MAALFPDDYFHIGGDEVNGEQWKKTAHIQAFMSDHSIKDNHDLQAYFTKRVQRIVAKHGKRTEGWDEVLAAGSAERHRDSILARPEAAGRSRAAGLLGNSFRRLLPGSHGAGLHALSGRSARKRISRLSPPKKNRASWAAKSACGAEYVSPENVDSRIWPRTAAIAERFWSPQEIRDIASMYRRVDAVSRKLDWLGLTHLSSYLPMLRRLAGDQPIDSLKVLADVVQPANQDARDEANNTQQTPLNRLVDAARSKSKTARDFAALVDKMDHLSSAPG